MTRDSKRILDGILELVSIQSFTGDWEEIGKCQAVIERIATELGFNSTVHANGKVLVIEPKNKVGRPKLGIVVHVDTVPYDESQWKHNPLGEISDGRVYGRGVIDDKAAIILSLYALSKVNPEYNWQLIVGSCEEGVWTDMQDYLAENNVLPEFMVTVDGDGVQNGCRGYLDLECYFKRTSDSRRITNLSIVDGANNSVPGKATATVDGIKIEMTGVAAHSSVPENGDNAFTHLLMGLKAEKIEDEFSGLFKLVEDLSSTYDASDIGFVKHSEELMGQRIGNTSVCLTNCKYSEEEVMVNLNIRLCARVTAEEVNAAIDHISNHYGCRCQISEVILPAYVSPDSWGVQKMLEAYEQVMGKSTISTIAMGVGYNAALPNCAIFGPRYSLGDDEEDTCHSADENRKVEDLFKFLEILEAFIGKF